ncbi:MAG: RNA polymerase sigma factor [Bacteroidetes bacterium]|nr:RNA polymerase sigma factor [Bacteroidota bacterium]
MNGLIHYTQFTDEELFELVKSHDDNAFRILYKRYDKRLYAYCFKVAGEKKGAEDLFQMTMTAIFEKRESFLGGSFVAWLFTIARNFSIKATKQARFSRNTILCLDDYTEIIEDKSDKTDVDILMQDALNSAISTLSDEYRRAIELRYYEGFSYEQISEELSISLSLAKVRVFRAKQQLQQILSPYLNEYQS